jgi:hypothetical protein
MTEPPTDVARRLRRAAQAHRHTTRYWAGWRLELTFGPYEQAFDPDRADFARRAAAEAYEQIYGTPPPTGPEADASSLEAQRDLWHLSVSWRGGHPAESARPLLAELVAALGVPEAEREGRQPARVFGPGGQSPQVTHWTWRDPT